MVGDVERDQMEPGVVQLRRGSAAARSGWRSARVTRGDVGVLQQIEGTGAALQAGAENEHLHWVVL